MLFPPCLPPFLVQQSLIIASIGGWAVILVSNAAAQGKLLLLGRHWLVSLAKLSPLVAVPGGPQSMQSAGLRKENIALLKPLVPQQALWSQTPALSLPQGCAGARDSALFLPPSSHHHALWPHALDPDVHDTQMPAHFSKTR